MAPSDVGNVLPFRLDFFIHALGHAVLLCFSSYVVPLLHPFPPHTYVMSFLVDFKLFQLHSGPIPSFPLGITTHRGKWEKHANSPWFGLSQILLQVRSAADTRYPMTTLPLEGFPLTCLRKQLGRVLFTALVLERTTTLSPGSEFSMGTTITET